MRILQTALSGIHTAQCRFEKSAEKLLNATTPVPEQQPVPTENQPAASVPEIGEQSTGYTASDTAFLEASVDMITSSFAYKTNIQVLKAWDETTEAVLSELKA